MKEALLGAAFMFVACMTILYVIDLLMRRDERRVRSSH